MSRLNEILAAVKAHQMSNDQARIYIDYEIKRIMSAKQELTWQRDQGILGTALNNVDDDLEVIQSWENHYDAFYNLELEQAMSLNF